MIHMNCEEWQCLGITGLFGTTDTDQYPKEMLEKLTGDGFLEYIGDATSSPTQAAVYQLTEKGLDFIKNVVKKNKMN